MVVNENPTQRPDDTAIAVNVGRGEGNIPFANHDLVADGGFVIPDDIAGLDLPPFIGGGSQSVLGVESTDSNNFSITFEYGVVDADGDFQVRLTYDKTDEAKLGGDTKYIILINTILDRVRVTMTDESGAGQNTIRGGLNSH